MASADDSTVEDLRRVLRAIRLTGVGGLDAIAARAGIPPSECESVLSGAMARGLVRRRDGRLSGWSLTPAGRDEGQRLMRHSVDRRIEPGLLAGYYREFLGHNRAVLEVCTAWQVTIGPAGVPRVNRHDDAAYDDDVIDRLVARHRAAAPLVSRLGGELEEFAGYAARLAHAVDRTLDGEHDWFTRPLMDSFHTVWFEMHEDLLLATGRERVEESGTEKPS